MTLIYEWPLYVPMCGAINSYTLTHSAHCFGIM